MITIDGSFGEGGGQILRSALALSLVTGKAFRIENIRAGRRKPGLLHQHLTAVKAAVRVGAAQSGGAELGSTDLYFAPQSINAGHYRFDVGTAGSCTLVLQTVLPALLTADGHSEIIVEGGTHNPSAPPFDFLAKCFLPIVNRMGPQVSATLERPGFYPVGGGRIVFSIEPSKTLAPIELLNRGQITRRLARALVALLPTEIAERELRTIGNKLHWEQDVLRPEVVVNTHGPGNAVIVEIESEHITEVFTGFGRRGVRAEQVATETADAVLRYLDANVPVGRHLADQLLIPMALAGGGRFRTLSPTQHTTTNIHVIEQFLTIVIDVTQLASDDCTIAIRST
jgi:RNA 3'-terminal phosphate cyclase (ATP)